MLSITVPFELNKKDVIPGQEPAGPTRNTCKIKPKILEDLQTIAKCPRNLMINGERQKRLIRLPGPLGHRSLQFRLRGQHEKPSSIIR